MTSRLKVGARPTRQSLRSAVDYHLEVTLAQERRNADPEDYHLALALAIREPVIRAMNSTEERVIKSGAKQIHYLSMEFLIGRLLSNNLRNLGLYDTCAEVAPGHGMNLADVLETRVRSRARKRRSGSAGSLLS